MKKTLGLLIGVIVCIVSAVLIFLFAKTKPITIFFWFGVFGALIGAWIIRRVNFKRPGDDVIGSVKAAKSLLFPYYFKWIGTAIAAVGVAVLIIADETAWFEPERWMWIPILVGMWMAMWSRERHDDEMMRQVRLTAAWLTLSGAILGTTAIVAIDTPVPIEIFMFVFMLYYRVVLWTFKLKLRRDEKYD